MLIEVFAELDAWVTGANVQARRDGVLPHTPCEIRVLRQTALIEASVDLTLAATQDVDVYANYEWPVRKEFERLLHLRGKSLDAHGHEVWMPDETQYDLVYDGRNVKGRLAQTDFVLLSKALKAPTKNAALVTEYLARGASERFLRLTRRYTVDLEPFL